MKKFCKYCQCRTEHAGGDCLECESLSLECELLSSIESDSDYSQDSYESSFIDDSELSN